MSSHQEVSVTCPVCGFTGNFIIWNSVNADISPEIADKVKDRSLFYGLVRNARAIYWCAIPAYITICPADL